MRGGGGGSRDCSSRTQSPLKPSEPRSSHIVLRYPVYLEQNRISVGGEMREEKSVAEEEEQHWVGGGGRMKGTEGRGGALMSARNFGVLHFFFSANKKLGSVKMYIWM